MSVSLQGGIARHYVSTVSVPETNRVPGFFCDMRDQQSEGTAGLESCPGQHRPRRQIAVTVAILLVAMVGASPMCTASVKEIEQLHASRRSSLCLSVGFEGKEWVRAET